jgi:hypothetical protein
VTPPANETPPKNFLRQPEWLVAAIITLAVVGFHFYFLLHAGGCWRDEVNLLNVATQHAIAEMTHDSFPLLMPLLVKIWTALGLGAADINLRLLGTLIGLGGLGALWLAAWTARRSPPLIGLVLFALNSTAITFGDELRAYGLGSLMIALLFAAAVYFLKQPSAKRAMLTALFAVLAVQSLFHNAVLVGAICLGAAAVCARRKNFCGAIQILGAGFVAAVSLLPYVQNFVAGRETVAVLRTGFSWPRFFHELETSVGFPWAQFAFVWALLALAVIFLAAKNFKNKPPENSTEEISVADVQLFAGATLLFAIAGFLGFLWLTALPGQPWYFLPLMILVAVCFDAVFAGCSCPKQCFFIAAVATTFFISLPVVKRDLNYRFTNLDGWAAALTSEAKPGDFAVVTPWFTGITFAHYFHGAMPWTTLPPLTDHTSHRYDQVQAQMKTPNAIAPVLGKISATLRAGQRIWLVCPADFVKQSLAASASPADLPAPPLPQTGWLDEPYSATWTMQAIHFLARHGKSFRQIPAPDAGQRIAENSGLFVIEGWNDATNPPPPNAK